MKNKFDFKSIRFKLWFYFIGFAMLLIILIWSLQIYFLDTYYEHMKREEVSKLASQIVNSFEEKNSDLFYLVDTINTLANSHQDVYFRVETIDGSAVISPEYSGPSVSSRYSRQIEELRISLLSNAALPSVTAITHTPGDAENARIMAHACYLNADSDFDDIGNNDLTLQFSNRYILYVISPLYPVQSTVSILRVQLVYITVIASVIALTLALYLARRISKPIKDITLSAAEMGKGNYSAAFNGGHYTEIIDLADTLTHASRELEKTDMYQKDLIANVSHDLRTPLTMIKSYAEMIRDLSGNNPEKREAHLGVIIEEADRLNNLVTDMLSMSRMQNRTIQLERVDFDMKEVTEALLTSYDLLCEQEGYHITFHNSGSLMVNGDVEKIKQVISNLINNAVKYCGEDKEVIINLKRLGRKMRFEVTDHGAGIAPDEINHVWERYYKSSTHHVRQTDGSGLGLSIVKEILTLHKAGYGVLSKLGAGSTFWFEMDLVKVKK